MERLKTPLTLFIILQLMDFLTTLVAIAMGGAEQNPLVQAFFTLRPVYGLALSKLVVISIAVAGYYARKTPRYPHRELCLFRNYHLEHFHHLPPGRHSDGLNFHKPGSF